MFGVLVIGEQREATLKNWTTGEQFGTQCSVYVLSVGGGGQRKRRWKDTKDWTTKRVAHISNVACPKHMTSCCKVLSGLGGSVNTSPTQSRHFGNLWFPSSVMNMTSCTPSHIVYMRERVYNSIILFF